VNSWYEYTTDRCWKGAAADKVEWAQFTEQRQRLLSLLEEEHARLPQGGRIILGGLSQGASLALDVLLHAPSCIDSIAGCFVLRGMVQEETQWNLSMDKVRHRAATCPICVYHGKLDTTVPWRVAKRSYKWLQDKGFEVEWEVEEWANHASESQREYQRVANFVTRVLYSDQYGAKGIGS
jgi:predicted esterase